MDAIRIEEKTNMGRTFTLALVIFLVILFATVGHAATITVTTNVHETGSSPDCSLYEAIEAANTNAAFGGCPAGQASPVVDTIAFNITTGGGAVKTIVPNTSMPDLTDPVFIDGSTQPGADCSVPGGLKVELIGVLAAGAGIRIAAGGAGSTVKGLVINLYSGAGIVIFGNNNLIVCNYIGTNVAGTTDNGNTGDGITIDSGSDNTIGGVSTADRNLISGNNANGILIRRSVAPASGNKVLGNYIGTNSAGTGALQNTELGVGVSGASDTLIGDDVAGAGNIISGSRTNGVGINKIGAFNAQNTTIENNIIGLDAAGTAPIVNLGVGIDVDNSSTTRIGGSTPLSRNVIGGNQNSGVRILSGATNVTIEGNYIGTDITGTLDRGNIFHGIQVIQATGVVIGGASAAQRNLISGNNQFGIHLQDTSDTVVKGNFIGTSADGLSAIGNGEGGIKASGIPLTGATIGGTTPGEGNRVMGNGDVGVRVESGTGVTILGNEIFGNADLGIDLGLNSGVGDGVSPNDTGDPDGGPNEMQNYPVLAAARFGASTQIVGTLNSTASRNFRIEFFSSPTADPSGFGEGQVYLGAISVTTNGSGNAAFNTILPASTSMGHVVTATATDTVANTTSEFSQARTLTQPTAAGVTLGGRVIDPNGRGIAKAAVILTDARGNTMRTLSNPFGYYSFPDIPAGETVFVSVTAKGYIFVPRAVVVLDELTNVDLIGIQVE
jgi:parallel beta-helix repeat protein